MPKHTTLPTFFCMFDFKIHAEKRQKCKIKDENAKKVNTYVFKFEKYICKISSKILFQKIMHKKAEMQKKKLCKKRWGPCMTKVAKLPGFSMIA